MKKHFPAFFSIAACILAGLCLLQLHDLEDRVRRLDMGLSNQTSQLLSSIGDIRAEVEERLEEEADILALSEWIYGEVDVEAETAEILCSIVPKEYSPDKTAVSLRFEDFTVPMQYENGRYTASAELPLFEETQTPWVLLEDDGVIRTQMLEWYISPRYEALPIVYAGNNGGWTWQSETDAALVKCDSTVEIFVDSRMPFRIRSMEFVEVLNGEEIGRLPVDLSEEGQLAYQGAMIERGEAVPAPEVTADEAPDTDDLYTGGQHFLYLWQKEYSIPNGGMLELYLDMVDGYGLRHRSYVDCIAVAEDGAPDHLRAELWIKHSYSEPRYIYDEGGELIFEIDEDRYS